MTEWLLELVPHYGTWLVAVVTFLSCLALPVPSSILMLAAGGFAASGDLMLWQVTGAALAGAILGDQIGRAERIEIVGDAELVEGVPPDWTCWHSPPEDR